MNDDFDFEDENVQQEGPFHIEVDLYETGDHSRLLVVPCSENYVIVHNDEHLCTLVHICDDPDCWEQTDGLLDEELVEKIGEAIKSFSY